MDKIKNETDQLRKKVRIIESKEMKMKGEYDDKLRR